MYTLTVDGVRIAASGRGRFAFESGRLVDRLSCAPTLDFTLLPGNPYAQGIGLRSSIVTVERDDVEIFRGFALSRDVSEAGFVRYAAVGDLSALRDVPVGPIDYVGSADQLIAGILATYNASAEARRKIYKGVIGRTGLGTSMTYQSTSWRSAWDLISGLCTDKGGILRLRYDNDGTRVLDWLDHCGNWAEQIVTWGDNLVSLRITEDASKVINTIIATGQTEQHEAILVTVSNALSVAKYGTIAVQKRYSDATTVLELQTLARADLDRESKASVVISGKAVDRLPEGKAPFRVGDFVLVRSVPHRIEEWSVISEISIDLTEGKLPQIAFGAISTGLTAPERTASINRWLVSLQGQAPLEVYAIDLDGYYAIDSDGYYAVADGSDL